MAELTPSGLETLSAHATGWHTILNTNAEKINNKLGTSIAPSATAHGSVTVDDAAAATADDLTDSTGGTAGTTLAATADTTTNDNFASLAAQHAKLKTDHAAVLTQLNALLAQLRAMGILAS